MASGASFLIASFLVVRFVVSIALSIETASKASLVRRGWDCDAYYGKPVAEHCQDALDQMPTSSTEIFFVSQPVDAPLSEPIQQLPKFWHSRTGDCTISLRSAVDDEPDEDNRDHDTDNWSHLGRVARSIVRTCVRLQQVGGFRTAGEYQDLIVYVYGLDSTYARLPPMTQAETLAAQLTTGEGPDSENDGASWTSMEEISPDRELPSSSDSSGHHTTGTRWHSPCGQAVYCVEQDDCCQGQKCRIDAFQRAVNQVIVFGITTLAGVGSAGFCGS